MLLATAGGCWAGAGVSMSAAEAIDAVAAQTRTALSEYHGEVEAADDAKEAAAIAAFVARLQKDAGDEQAAASHAAAFQTAMAKLRADRRTEWQRHTAAVDNVRLLNEVTAGLRRVAIESLTLQDEVKRYLTDLVNARKQAVAAQSPAQQGARP